MGRARRVAVAAGATVGAEEAMRLVTRDGYKVLDVRSAREYGQQHITKPPRVSISAPARLGDLQGLLAQAPRAAKLIVMDADGGELSQWAAAQLAGAGWGDALLLAGGYAAWGEVWSPSGKRRPPPGRWVPTGKEALKSALNVGDAAASYEEGGNLDRARYNERGL